MTTQQFRDAVFTSHTRVADIHGFKGYVTSVNFQFGWIHFVDDVKRSYYGYHYSELTLIE